MIIIDNDNITCDGYTVNSKFLNNGIPITCNINNDNLFGKSVPIGLSFLKVIYRLILHYFCTEKFWKQLNK
jgi:hypothetical protein